MLELWKRFRIGTVIISIGMLILGIVMLIWPDISATTVCWVMGVLCLAAGISQIVRYFRMGLFGVFFRFDLTLGILGSIAGLLLLSRPQEAARMLPIAAGLYILMSSIFDIQTAVEMRRMYMGNWWLCLLLGILNTLFAACLLLDPFSGVYTLMMFLGVSLIARSLENLYSMYCLNHALKRLKPIDVEWTPVE